MTMVLENLEQDIPRSVAYAAHAGTSFVPERRADQRLAEYAATLRADYDELAKHADTDEKRALLNAEFERYRAGYKAYTLKYLHSHGRIVSTMIAGPSGFPVRQMEKRNNVAHKRLTELVEFRPRALAAIRRKLHPELRPIMSGDADAVERLQTKIADAEKLQEIMKTTNATIRKHKKAGRDAQIAALVAMGHPDRRAHQLLEPDWCGRIGFADFELTNNNANIKRMKGRLAQIGRAKATPETSHEGASATIEDSPAENRVKLFFPGKPDASIRSRLKSSGFRWSPNSGCWQAYRNSRTIDLAKEIAK